MSPSPIHSHTIDGTVLSVVENKFSVSLADMTLSGDPPIPSNSDKHWFTTSLLHEPISEARK